MRFEAEDMVACLDTGVRLLSFVVKGSPSIQKRPVMVWTPLQMKMVAVRLEMASMGLTTFPYFTEDATAIKVDVKFVVPRTRMDLVMHPSPTPPPHSKCLILSRWKEN
jgi:hypothetical protein